MDEHLGPNETVAGSSPASPTIKVGSLWASRDDTKWLAKVLGVGRDHVKYVLVRRENTSAEQLTSWTWPTQKFTREYSPWV
jgi:hypothetical protein